MPDEITRRRGPSGLYKVEWQDTAILIAQRSTGDYIAFYEQCPHQQVKLSKAGEVRDPDEVTCQVHQIVYSLMTGDATQNPTVEDPGCLNLLEVERDGDEFVISLS